MPGPEVASALTIAGAGLERAVAGELASLFITHRDRLFAPSNRLFALFITPCDRLFALFIAPCDRLFALF